jgi:hypothetical protein
MRAKLGIASLDDSFYYARMLPTAALPAEGAQVSAPHWTMLQCWAFRVVFVYFILDALPDLLRRLPGGFSVLVVYWKTWNAILPWFGRHVLRLPDPQGLVLPISPVLLGDFAGAYVLMLVFLLLAVIVATIWTIADPRRSDHRALHGWLRVYVRYALAFSMLGYGISKLLQVQFRPLDVVDLMTPVGMLQPRELLWDFMGFSRPYQAFTGVVECVGVALLFFRRTTLLGALILIGALTNVLMIDIAYGVSVRRIALRLLLLALVLAAADLRRLVNLLVVHRPAGRASVDGPTWESHWARRAALAAKAIVILSVVASVATELYHERTLVVAARPALYGVFSVQRVVRDGREDAGVWKWIAIDGRSVAIGSSNAAWERRRATFDDARQSITLSSGRQSQSVLTYSGDGDNVRMAGVLDDHPTEFVLRRVSEPRFALQDATRVR